MLLGARQFFERRGAPTPSLPYDAEVEWIGQEQGTYHAYLKTFVVPPVGSVLRCRFQFTDTRNSFNAIGNLSSRRFGFGIEQGTFKVCTSAWVQLVASKDTDWHSWVIDEPNRTASLDDTSVSINPHTAFSGDSWLANGGFLLFGRLTSTGAREYDTYGARCASLYIGTSDGSLFDGIPVRFTDELGVSKGAMYDRVSGALFRNAGTGAFTIGPDKS